MKNHKVIDSCLNQEKKLACSVTNPTLSSPELNARVSANNLE